MKKNTPSQIDTLRQKAEAQLKNSSTKKKSDLSEIESLKAIHELEVHQIELELQNEELIQAQIAAQQAAEKYHELYDFAPLGYFTLSDLGEIIELNFSGANLLGKERSLLKNRLFENYLSHGTKSIFKKFLKKIFDSNSKETCEVTLLTCMEKHIDIFLTGMVTSTGNQCQLTAVDISERKKAEDKIRETQILLQASIESPKDMIILSIDKQYQYFYFNTYHKKVMQNAYGVDVKLGMNLLECITSEDDRNKAKKNYDKALNGESHSTIEEYGELNRLYYETRYNPVYNEKNEVIGATAFSANVTERIQAAKLLELQNVTLSKLNSFAIELSMLPTGEDLELLIVKRIKEISGAEIAIFNEYNSESRTSITKQIEMEPGMLQKVVGLLGKQVKKIQSPVSTELYEIITKEIIGVRKTLHEASFGSVSRPVGAAIQALLNVDRFIGLAFLIEGKLYGTSLLAMKKGIPDPPRQTLETFIFLAAVSLRRKKAEDDLYKTNRLWDSVVENIPSMIFLKDASTLKFIRFNQAGEDLLGIAKEGMIGKNDYDFFTKEQADFFIKKDKEVLQNKHLVDIPEEPIQTKQKGIRILHTKKVPILTAAGEPEYLLGISEDITEQKLTEQNLLEQTNAMEASVDGIAILNANNVYTNINKAHLKIYGYENSNELLGKSWRMLYNNSELQRFENEIMPELMQNGHFQGQAIGKKKDGSLFHQEISLTALDNGGLICVVRDITERKNAEESLNKLKTAIETSKVSIVITDNSGTIEYANPYFTQLSGYSRDEYIGLNPRILKSGVHPTEYYTELWNTIKSGNTWEGEFYNIKKNGQYYWEHAIISPIKNSDNEISHFVAIKTDITIAKNINEELIKAKNNAEESDRLKSAFLANMSHEIRTPMNGILGFAELLKEPLLNGEEQQEYISIIEKSGIRMLNILNDIINISKIEAGQMETIISDTNVNEQIEYIYDFFKPEAEQKNIQLSICNTLPNSQVIVKTDREKLNSILTNLVKNAIKFTNQGNIEFGCKKRDSDILFYVKDTGMGIPEELKETIFERFRQGSELLTRDYEGAGLGLAISKAYTKMLGGNIWVESNSEISSGKTGSNFYFTIPCTCSEKIEIDSKANELVKSNEIQIAPNVSGLKILVAEDDEISQLFLTKLLENFSNSIIIVNSGTEAIEVCKQNNDLDLILMDIRMPEMDGYEATREIRKFNKHIVIIAQTAFSLTGDREKAIAAGCNDYISKPIDQVLLKALISKYFKKK